MATFLIILLFSSFNVNICFFLDCTFLYVLFRILIQQKFTNKSVAVVVAVVVFV